MYWIGILIVVVIVGVLLLLSFSRDITCPQCKSKDIETNYKGIYEYRCKRCGREFNRYY